MTIQLLSESAHKNALRRIKYSDDPMQDIIDKLKEELSELEKAHKENKHADYWSYLGEMMVEEDNRESIQNHIKDTQEDELCDIVLVCMAGMIQLGMSPDFALGIKDEYNGVRND